jgi:hypothetical protein
MGYHHHALSGRITVYLVDKRGHRVDQVDQSNEIVNDGRMLIGQLLTGDTLATPISHLAVGTGQTPPAPTDAALEMESASIDRSPISVTPLTDPNNIGLRVSAQVSSATNQAISEAGLFNASEHNTGTIYNRVVFPSPLPIGTDLDLVIEWDITF